MKKKIIPVIALVLMLACALAACGNKNKDKTPANTHPQAGEVTTASPIIAVSETQYQYVTDANGEYETVIMTDAAGESHAYLKAVRSTDVSGTQVSPTVTDNSGASAALPAQTQIEIINDTTAVSDFVNMFKSGSFRLEGTMVSDGESVPMGIIVSGSDMRMKANMENTQFEIALINKKIYLINPEKKTYMEVGALLKSIVGIDESMFTEMTDIFKNYGTISVDKLSKTSATYNGKTVDCYTTTPLSDGGTNKFYVDNGKVVCIETYEASGVCTSKLDISIASGNVSASDVAISSGYTKSSMTSFMMDFAGSMD